MNGTDETSGVELPKVELLIIGAGPAGAACALRAARLGARPWLIDRRAFPRWKVCGCCLNRSGAAVLDRLGVGGLWDRAVRLEHWEGRAGDARARQRLGGAWAVAREDLDTALVEAAARQGAEVRERTEARVVASGDDAVAVELRGPNGRAERVAARVVVLASGLADPGARRWLPWTTAPRGPLGAGITVDTAAGYEPGVVYMACGTGGYVGAVRLADGRLDLAAALAGGGRREPLASRMVAILDRCGLPVPEALSGGAVRGTPRLTRRRLPAARRMFAIGDALGYVEPFTGEGMAWALAAGEAVAPLATAGAERWDDRLAAQWCRAVARYRRRQLPCRLIAGALRERRLRYGAIALLAAAPWIGRPVIRRLHAA